LFLFSDEDSDDDRDDRDEDFTPSSSKTRRILKKSAKKKPAIPTFLGKKGLKHTAMTASKKNKAPVQIEKKARSQKNVASRDLHRWQVSPQVKDNNLMRDDATQASPDWQKVTTRSYSPSLKVFTCTQRLSYRCLEVLPLSIWN